ncbi:molybdenum cofactor guanylyltransferase [Enterococcus sp. AZ192]|uniref:molybdenum cofactor guanylyltransferase n=1 Tax=unclassified Enterococcus TaxID=2608891 RepID=UPI003D27E3FF
MIKEATAVILCGGKSTRMGFDKSLLKVNGEFVLLRTVKQLQKTFPKVLLVANQRTKFPAVFSQVAIIEDHYHEKGPLGGLATGLEEIETEYLFLVACDIPNLTVDLIRIMTEHLSTYQIVLCQQNGRLEPLFAFYHRSCLSVFQQQLTSKNWRIAKEFDRFSVKIITLETSTTINNVNTPKELVFWN